MSFCFLCMASLVRASRVILKKKNTKYGFIGKRLRIGRIRNKLLTALELYSTTQKVISN